jgi:hypothetical protein
VVRCQSTWNYSITTPTTIFYKFVCVCVCVCGHNRRHTGRSSCFPAQADRISTLYHDLLHYALPRLFQDVLLQTRVCMWFMHDVAQSHSSIAVRTFLNDNIRDEADQLRGPQVSRLQPAGFLFMGSS